jgi:predicted transcriptional regulator
MAKTELQVGQGLRGVLAEVGAAWKAAEAGHLQEPSSRLCFVDWAALCAVLTPKRYELIRQLRREPSPGIRALARTLGRDVKRVHQDVVALEELGLIHRDEETGALSTDLDEVSSTIKFAA